MRSLRPVLVGLALPGLVAAASHGAGISGGTTTRVSPATDPSGDSTYGAVSSGARIVAFDSTSALAPTDVNGVTDVYARDMATGSITLISSGAPGTRAFDPAISADGRLIAYVARGPGQGLYVHDRSTGSSLLVAAGYGAFPSISPDGRWALMHLGLSFAIVDLATGARTWMVGESASVSSTGRLAFFTARALVAEDTDGMWDVYRRDLHTGELELVTGDIADHALHPVISSDGNHLAFESIPSSQLHPIRLHVQDLRTGARVLISESVEPYDLPAISADGSTVAFASPGLLLGATNTGGTEPLAVPGIYVWDRTSGGTTLVSVRTGGGPGAWARPTKPAPFCFIQVADPVCIPYLPTPLKLGINAANPHVSPDGRWVVFDTPQRLTETDTDDAADVYLHDRG